MVFQLLRPMGDVNLRCVSSDSLRQSGCIHLNPCSRLSQRSFTAQRQGASKSILLHTVSLFGLSLEEDCNIELDFSSTFNADWLPELELITEGLAPNSMDRWREKKEISKWRAWAGLVFVLALAKQCKLLSLWFRFIVCTNLVLTSFNVTVKDNTCNAFLWKVWRLNFSIYCSRRFEEVNHVELVLAELFAID